MNFYVDSHAHLTSDEMFDQIEAVLQRAQEAHVGTIINICTDLKTLKRGLELSHRYPWIYQAAATTPHDVEKEGEAVFASIAQHAYQGHLQAVGETGLDYYYAHSQPTIQKEFLKRYLKLALDCQLPVIIHCREAFGDLFKIIDENYQLNGRHAPGVLHCFTGNRQEAQEVIARGWMLSLSGIVTFKKSHELQQVAREIPLSQLLIETDAPYLAPQSKRGQKNEPSFIPETASFIASLRKIPLQEVIQATTTNTLKLFKINN
jgi:TatD DNase family protein